MQSQCVVCLLHPFWTWRRNPDGSFLFPGYLISLFTLIRRITETSSCLLFFGFVDSISFLTQFASSQNHLLKEKWGAGNPPETRSLTFRRVILSAYCRNTCCEIVRLECSSSAFTSLTLLFLIRRLLVTSSNLSLGKYELARWKPAFHRLWRTSTIICEWVEWCVSRRRTRMLKSEKIRNFISQCLTVSWAVYVVCPVVWIPSLFKCGGTKSIWGWNSN